MKRVRFTFAIAALLGSGFAPANAQNLGSSYTSTAPKDCRTIGKPDELDGSTTRVCPGKSGLVVVIAEDDLREVVSIGRNRAAAAKEPAAQVRFHPFNSSAHTIEWRASDGKPFAIIQRWLMADNSELDKNGRPTDKPMLVVTRLPPGPVCHVAYVDAQANRDANALARKAADEFARDFQCAKDEVKVIGATGIAVGLAKLP
jgi:hypothetical protein